MSSLELNCENLEVALLQAQASLSGFLVANFAKDTGSAQDRIIVRAMPREVELPSHRLDATPKAWRVAVEVTVHYMTKDSVAFDAVIAAVQAANNGTPPPGIVTTAAGIFPNGVLIEDTDEGDAEHTDNTRTRTKFFRFVVKP